MSDCLGLEELEKLPLPPEIVKSIKHARIEAQNIIDFLNPRNVISWTGLLSDLRTALYRARKNSNLFYS